MWTSVTILVVSVIAVATKATVGPCRPDITADATIDYQQFATENGGKWIYKMMPELGEELILNRIHSLEIKRSTQRPEDWETKIYLQTNECKPELLAEGLSSYQGDGRSKTIINAGNSLLEFKFTFLKYVPGQYVYYFVCTDGNDTDQETDYRYVVTPGTNLTTAQEAEIRHIDEQNKFKRALKFIDLSPCTDGE